MSIDFSDASAVFDTSRGMILFSGYDRGTPVYFGVTRRAMLALAGRLAGDASVLLSTFVVRRADIQKAAERVYDRSLADKTGQCVPNGLFVIKVRDFEES